MFSSPILALVLASLTAASAAVVPVYFGRRKPGYSHLRDTISELGENGVACGRARVLFWVRCDRDLALALFGCCRRSIAKRIDGRVLVAVASWGGVLWWRNFSV